MRWKVWLWLGIEWIGVAGLGNAQDVFWGGKFDVELSLGSTVAWDFSRESGLDLHYTTPRTRVTYQFNLAGGRGRVSQFYARWLFNGGPRVALGRFLAPFGSPVLEPLDKYVAGGPDVFDNFAAYRTGNVFVDTFADGLWISWAAGGERVDLATAFAPDRRHWNSFLRFRSVLGGVEGGLSFFSGQGAAGTYARALAFDAYGELPWGGFQVEPLWGRLGGRNYQALFVEAHGYRGMRWEGGVKVGLYDPEGGSSTATWKFLARYWETPSGFWEVRYEWNKAPGPAGQDRWVLRYRLEF